MDHLSEGLEFLDLSDASDNDKMLIKNILVRGDYPFRIPWNLPESDAGSTSAVTPTTSVPYQGVHVNGRSEDVCENVDRGVYQNPHFIQSTVPNSVPSGPVYPLVNPQGNVFVNTPNLSLQNFHHSLPYAGYANSDPSSGQEIRSVNNVQRPRSAKSAKRPDPVSHTPSPNFTFSPGAPTYIPAVPPFSLYQASSGIPPAHTMPNYYPQIQQYPSHLIPCYTPTGTVFSPPAAPHPPMEEQELKEQVPYEHLPEHIQQPLPPPQTIHQQPQLQQVPLPAQLPPVQQEQLPSIQQQPVQIPPPKPLNKTITSSSAPEVQPPQQPATFRATPVESPKVKQSKDDINLESNTMDDQKNSDQSVSQSNSVATNDEVIKQDKILKPAVTEQPKLQQTTINPSQQSSCPAPVDHHRPSYASLFASSSSPSASVKQKFTAICSPLSQNDFPNQLSLNSKPSQAATASPLQKHGAHTPYLPSPSLGDDPGLLRLAEFLMSYKLDHRPAVLKPRGLTNRSNYCYINATLQALLACPPLYNLLKSLPLQPRKSNAISKSKTPIIDSMVQFVNEFEEMSHPSLLKCRREKAQAREDKQNNAASMEVDLGAAFEPTYVYKMMNVIRNDSAFPIEGRQEDAEEFLSCLLNGLNDEMVELLRLADDNVSNGDVAATNGDSYLDQESDNEWKEVSNNKNKQTITRRTKLFSTPLSQIFQGQWRSRVTRQGACETDNVQPFFTFPLDIEKSHSVKEALENITAKNTLEGFTCPKTNQTVDAYQQLYLEELPLVLLLHLKCFDFKLQTCSKIIKSVDFSIELKIEPKLLCNPGKSKNRKSTPGNSMKEREYKLFAVVYHDGKEATKGHYITDVYHVGYGAWVRYDDANVKTVSQVQVLNPKSPRVPYLLYYRRKDTICTPQTSKPQKTAGTDS